MMKRCASVGGTGEAEGVESLTRRHEDTKVGVRVVAGGWVMSLE
jgi:hypothetical protein